MNTLLQTLSTILTKSFNDTCLQWWSRSCFWSVGRCCKLFPRFWHQARSSATCTPRCESPRPVFESARLFGMKKGFTFMSEPFLDVKKEMWLLSTQQKPLSMHYSCRRSSEANSHMEERMLFLQPSSQMCVLLHIFKSMTMIFWACLCFKWHFYI